MHGIRIKKITPFLFTKLYTVFWQKYCFRDTRELTRETGTTANTDGVTPVRSDPSIDNDQEVALQNTRKKPTKASFWKPTRRAIENYSREIFWMVLYTLVLLAIFAERSYCKY
jgi:hypothetical protein